jgi:hypothetical protein
MSDEQLTPQGGAEDELTHEVFRLLFERYPALVPLEELVREFRFPPGTDRDSPANFVHEAVERLYHLGLAYRIDGFAFASRAGMTAVELHG